MAVLINTFETGCGIHSLAISSQDQVLTGSNDGTIRLWNITNGKILRTIQAHKQYFGALAISPDGKIAVSGDQKYLKVWDIKSGSLIREIKSYVDDTNTLVITPKGFCISGHDYGGILVWDLKTGERIKTLEGPEIKVLSILLADPESILALALTPTADRVIAGTYRGFLYIWDINSFECCGSIAGHIYGVSGILLLPDSQQGISTARDGTVCTWETGKRVMHSELVWEGGLSIQSISLMPNGRRAVWGNEKGMLCFWDIKRRLIRSQIPAHQKAVTGVAVTGGGRLISVSEDGTLKVWGNVSKKKK